MNNSKKKTIRSRELSSSSHNIDGSTKLIYERRSTRYIILFFSGLLGVLAFLGYSFPYSLPKFGIVNVLYLEYYDKDVKVKILLDCYSLKTIQKIKELIPNLIIK